MTNFPFSTQQKPFYLSLTIKERIFVQTTLYEKKKNSKVWIETKKKNLKLKNCVHLYTDLPKKMKKQQLFIHEMMIKKKKNL